MVLTGFESNSCILAELGDRIKDTRIADSLTQAELAARAGVSLRTLAKIESGCDTTLSSYFNVLRALGLLANVSALVPEQGVRPSDLQRLGKKRQRATSAARKAKTEPAVWVWGEDR